MSFDGDKLAMLMRDAYQGSIDWGAQKIIAIAAEHRVNSLEPDELCRVANACYWMVPDISVLWLAPAFGLDQHHFMALVEARVMDATCERCDRPIPFLMRSREDRDRTRGLVMFCSDCSLRFRYEQHEEAWRRSSSRRARVAELRGLPYAQYLTTSEWQATRQEALERARNRCSTCGSSDDLQVHHNTYDRLGCEDPADLIVLCKGCHYLFHKNGRLTS
jgi:5-methylcytosine-specific restriction endonuclease McrA